MSYNLTLELLIEEAKNFINEQSEINHVELIGVTDGKAVGTYVEHKFKSYLSSKYKFNSGNSAKGIDLPSNDLNVDIKVTSIIQPQSSCPYRSPRQKIYGLGYNLLVFVYQKIDEVKSCKLDFRNCTFIPAERTGDYVTTKRILEMLKDEANVEDFIAYFQDKNIPGDEITYLNLAEEVLANHPNQGFLTISNALQWRLQYSRVISLQNKVEDILNYDRK